MGEGKPRSKGPSVGLNVCANQKKGKKAYHHTPVQQRSLTALGGREGGKSHQMRIQPKERKKRQVCAVWYE